jgi:hypothetical protein
MENTSNPYQTKFLTRSIQHQHDPGPSLKILKKEEIRSHTAPKILVYPLDQLTQVLSTTFVSLTQVYSLLAQAKENPIINKKAIEQLQEKINTINKMISTLTVELDNLGI